MMRTCGCRFCNLLAASFVARIDVVVVAVARAGLQFRVVDYGFRSASSR
jgi:hypothetical protein